MFLKLRCEYEIKQTPSSSPGIYIDWKTVEVYPFENSPLFAVATPSDWWRTASSRRFGVFKHRFLPKSYTSRTCITFGGNLNELCSFFGRLTWESMGNHKMCDMLETAGHRAKRTKIWTLGVNLVYLVLLSVKSSRWVWGHLVHFWFSPILLLHLGNR